MVLLGTLKICLGQKMNEIAKFKIVDEILIYWTKTQNEFMKFDF